MSLLAVAGGAAIGARFSLQGSLCALLAESSLCLTTERSSELPVLIRKFAEPILRHPVVPSARIKSATAIQRTITCDLKVPSVYSKQVHFSSTLVETEVAQGMW